jgi:RNA polymerase sigma-70 factor (ECF subfamily)
MKNNISELVKRLADSDAKAFTELMDSYRKKIYYVAYQMLGDHLDADEVVQETFVRIYRKRKELAHVTNFTSFLVRVATNYSIDLLRKRKGHSTIEDSTTLPGEVQLDLARKVRTPREHFQNKVLRDKIAQALDTLPPRQKITALLHDVEGYSKAEIARILECPEATVRSNLHIARKKLKAILTKRLAE